MLIKRSILALLCFAFSAVALVSAHGQVVPSATERVFTVRAGGLASAFQPDYTNEGAAITGPYRVYGVGAYVDAHFSRWVQPEFEVRFLRFNEYVQNGFTYQQSQNTYSIGERVPIINSFHKFTPYGKFLVGFGNGDFLQSGNALVLTYGGGVDYRLNRKFTIRCADFEFQQWPVSSANPNPPGGTTSFNVWPYGLSAGMSYRIF